MSKVVTQHCCRWMQRSLYNVAPSSSQKGLISAVCVILISLDLRAILSVGAKKGFTSGQSQTPISVQPRVGNEKFKVSGTLVLALKKFNNSLKLFLWLILTKAENVIHTLKNLIIRNTKNYACGIVPASLKILQS